MKVFLLDNYDSFTYMLKDYIEQFNVECLVKRNDDSAITDILIDQCDAIVISPGPGTPFESGKLLHIIGEFYKSKPMLGVCLGHQGIGEFFGAHLIKAKVPVHGKMEEIFHLDHPLFTDISNTFYATRYHSLLLADLPDSLKVIAYSKGNEIMGISHLDLPVFGIQFHPESCMTTVGKKVIGNFLNIAKNLG